MNCETCTTLTLDITRADRRVLEALRDHGASHVQTAARYELSRRKARYFGPVLVRLGDRTYAFDGNGYKLAVGDAVCVETSISETTGIVVGHGTGTWDPRLHGSLRPVTGLA